MDLLERIRDEVAVNRAPKWGRFPHAFSHIFAGGYGAGYYSYKWAEVLSADAYAAFEEAPDQLAATGARFRAEVLSRGGSRSALENFTAFRGREPRIDALLRHSGMAA
jgi:oligopeptidase A